MDIVIYIRLVPLCGGRYRYNLDGKIEQHIEVRNDEVSNTITTVTKDSLVIEKGIDEQRK